MVYLDNGATSYPKPECVCQAVSKAMAECANPGRGSHPAARAGAQVLYQCREAAGALFRCSPEQVVFTMNCTQGLNMAIRTLVKPGMKVVVSGFEHNAVTRTLHGLGARMMVAGRRLFCPEDTLEEFDRCLHRGAQAAVFTHVSNVFGYILPIEQMAQMCRRRGIPFVIDAAQSAGALPLDAQALGADFIAMPGHKGLLGPMGTGLLLCRRLPRPWLTGGTGSESLRQQMPDFLPDRGEAGTMNVPGIAGLDAGIRYVLERTPAQIGLAEQQAAALAARRLRDLGLEVFSGDHQLGTVSFRCAMDCEQAALLLAQEGIAVRAGLHCAPLAHQSAGTLDTGTVRISFGHDASQAQVDALEHAAAARLCPG